MRRAGGGWAPSAMGSAATGGLLSDHNMAVRSWLPLRACCCRLPPGGRGRPGRCRCCGWWRVDRVIIPWQEEERTKCCGREGGGHWPAAKQQPQSAAAAALPAGPGVRPARRGRRTELEESFCFFFLLLSCLARYQRLPLAILVCPACGLLVENLAYSYEHKRATGAEFFLQASHALP